MSDYLARRMAEIEKKSDETPDILMALEHPQNKQEQPADDTNLKKQLSEYKTNYLELHNIYTRTQNVLEEYNSISGELTAEVHELDQALDDGRGAIIKMKQVLKELLEFKIDE